MENEPRLAAAVTAALFSPDPAVAATRDGYTSIMRGWLAASVGPDEVPPEVEDVLEHVFFSTMVGLVNGRRPPSDVGDQLEQAARLLLAGIRVPSVLPLRRAASVGPGERGTSEP